MKIRVCRLIGVPEQRTIADSPLRPLAGNATGHPITLIPDEQPMKKTLALLPLAFAYSAFCIAASMISIPYWRWIGLIK